MSLYYYLTHIKNNNIFLLYNFLFSNYYNISALFYKYWKNFKLLLKFKLSVQVNMNFRFKNYGFFFIKYTTNTIKLPQILNNCKNNSNLQKLGIYIYQYYFYKRFKI